MLTELKPAINFYETFVSGKKKPIVVLQNLLKAGIVNNYVMYQGKNEVRIAANELIKVAVSKDSVSLQGMGKISSAPVSDPWEQVAELFNNLPIENWTAYGYVAFDIARFYSSYSKAIEQDILYFFIPEIELRFTERGVYVRSTRSVEQICSLLFIDSEIPNYVANELVVDFGDWRSSASAVNGDRVKYQQQINTLIKAIKNSELHKAIISRSVKISGDLDVLGTYVVGSQANNAPRSYCLKIDDVRAVGFSPEILIDLNKDGFVVTNPLAGTRPRGGDLPEDIRFNSELFTDAKEVKEHALSIWLAQSEIASVSLPETVQIFNFMEVKKYRCVQHLSSRVGGQLKPEKTLWDALKVLFPGITVSGIDKTKALEWIDRLETEPRGIYAGGIGWVNSQGMADLAIAIRSVYQYGDSIYLNAGAGIVAESIPENEYIESVNKMNTMLTNLVLQSGKSN
ncbi:anthranilate synthase component I family protein [Oscillatoria salina]|uniref:anthranilate synthase component I family protein n=1 Tax=Oscillatoria salina TaxID=331517 RepID=UPI001CCB0481|nr:chorismate-binding protein [Oscillatoria salina]MBZ8179858.1 salicylate synthase [Oscillatoria salina IIICB1]